MYVHEGGVALLQNLVGRGGPRVDAAQPEEDVFADLCVYVCLFMVCVWVSIKQTRGLGPAGIEGTDNHPRTNRDEEEDGGGEVPAWLRVVLREEAAAVRHLID